VAQIQFFPETCLVVTSPNPAYKSERPAAAGFSDHRKVRLHGSDAVDVQSGNGSVATEPCTFWTRPAVTSLALVFRETATLAAELSRPTTLPPGADAASLRTISPPPTADV
jgi:hypothetical protein